MSVRSDESKGMLEHAGLEGGSFNLVVFENERQLERLLGKVGCSVEGDGRIKKRDGDYAHCSSCEEDIQVSNVGHILPGSQYFYCDDPVCVMDYLSRFG